MAARLDRRLPFAWTQSEMQNENFSIWMIKYLEKKGFSIPIERIYELPNVNLQRENTFNFLKLTGYGAYQHNQYYLILGIRVEAIKDLGIDMKRAWSVAKSRSKKSSAKFFRSYSLSDYSIAIIDNMANRHQISKSEALERIIVGFQSLSTNKGNPFP